MRPYAVIQAPSSLGLSVEGVEDAPGKLLELGLAERIEARVAESLSVPPKDGGHGRDHQILNAEAIAAWSPKLANAVEAVTTAGEWPVVLGGDCTIILGTMLALRRRGRYGLLFIDGHADFFQPEAEPKREGASMDLALATGHGPRLLTNLEGRRPIVRTEDVVAFGFRDHADQARYGSQPLPRSLAAFDLPAILRAGIGPATRAAVDHLTRRELDGFFIHFDVDCLDDAIMPAVDYRAPGGLSWDDMGTALQIGLASGKAVGLEVTVYNPHLDRDGIAGRGLVEALVAGLTQPARSKAD